MKKGSSDRPRSLCLQCAVEARQRGRPIPEGLPGLVADGSELNRPDIADELLQHGQLVAGGRRDPVDIAHLARVIQAEAQHIGQPAIRAETQAQDVLFRNIGRIEGDGTGPTLDVVPGIVSVSNVPVVAGAPRMARTSSRV